MLSLLQVKSNNYCISWVPVCSIQHAIRIWCILLQFVVCLVLPYFSTLSHKQRDFRGRVIEHVYKTWIMWEPNCAMWKYRLTHTHRQTDRHYEADSRFSQKIALWATGSKPNPVGPVVVSKMAEKHTYYCDLQNTFPVCRDIMKYHTLSSWTMDGFLVKCL